MAPAAQNTGSSDPKVSVSLDDRLRCAVRIQLGFPPFKFAPIRVIRVKPFSISACQHFSICLLILRLLRFFAANKIRVYPCPFVVKVLV